MFQGKQFGAILGFANIGYGLGAALGTWLYGYIFDVTGTYTMAIVVAMIAVCVKCAAMWVAAPRKIKMVVTYSHKGYRL